MANVFLRPLARDDFDQVLAIAAHAREQDGTPQVLTMDELHDELDDELVVLATDARAAVRDGEIVGYVYTYHLPSEVREERCYVFGEVDPAARRQGVGTLLMQWALSRAADQLHSSGRSLPRHIRTDRYDYLEGAHRLFEHVGMRPVRYGEELLRPLTDLPPLTTVDGVRIVPWPADRDEDIRQEKNTAFADHWGSTPTSAAHWAQSVRGHGARPDLSFIALDPDDRVVAHCLNKRFEADDESIGRRDGWIDSLGTLAEWRGRGVASALVAASLHAFAAAGCTHASIGVDSQNPTGAARLYRNLGFEVLQRSITHELTVG